MNDGMIGKVMLITWAKVGVIFDNTEETEDSLRWDISVPATSYERMEDGTMLAGDRLAKRVKECAVDMGVKRLTVQYRIRREDWTKEKAEAAEIKMKKFLFKSQW